MTQSIGDDVVVAPAGLDEPAEQEEAAARERPPTTGQLRRERRRLWDLRQESVYHLGGLALDLHGRGMLGDDLITLRAEVIADLDRRMAILDALLEEADGRRRRGRVRAPDPVGYCLSCGAPHQSEAAFCFRCGARIRTPEEDGDTQVIAMPEPGGR